MSNVLALGMFPILLVFKVCLSPSLLPSSSPENKLRASCELGKDSYHLTTFPAPFHFEIKTLLSCLVGLEFAILPTSVFKVAGMDRPDLSGPESVRPTRCSWAW